MINRYKIPGHLVILIIIVIILLALLTKPIIPSLKNFLVKGNISQNEKAYKKNISPKKIYHSKEIKKIQTLKDISFLLEGKFLNFDCEVFEKAQRYYLPLDVIANNLKGHYYEDNDTDKINIFYNDTNYTLYKNSSLVHIENQPYFKLRGEIISRNNRTYLSLSDIENLFNLVDNWDYTNRKIYLFKSRKNIIRAEANPSAQGALIRFEDLTAGEITNSSESITKLKIIADYMYSEGAKFNVAWIPRYMNQPQNTDNNLLEVSKIGNAHYINMLDHIILKGGTIGLHGYTHQSGNEQTAIGVELNSVTNNDVDSTRRIVTSALDTAYKLNIPVDFFETPHYSATELQQSVIEEYFDYMYEPYVGLFNKKVIVSPRNNRTFYVPTPLGYVAEDLADPMIEKIKSATDGTLISFFYHPGKEFSSIQLYTAEDGYLDYSYSEDSILHKLVKAIKDYGYTPISITDIK